MHLQRGHLVHNSEITVAIDPNSSNVLRDIQEHLQLMRANMTNFSERIESIETLQIRRILMTMAGTVKGQFVVDSY
jgi:hypothetical protein